jgi:energy-coupling factor transporter ATP-binding protein EcfA2
MMIDDNFISRLGLPTKFPEFFPAEIEAYRRSRTDASGSPDEFTAAYMLTAVSTAIGGNVTACIQQGWCTRANLFALVVGPKGMGKSTLASTVLKPLVDHEEELRASGFMGSVIRNPDDADEKDGSTTDPCVIINDVTGQAALELLETNDRQLLVNTDEMSALFGRNSSGADRQVWLELYDGRRRRRHRVGDNRKGRQPLESPYVSMLGTIQSSLLKAAYNQRGDDGMLDRFLLVGPPTSRQPEWPKDTDQPALNRAWAEAIARLFRIESLAGDAVNGRLDVMFKPEALEVFKRFQDDVNTLILALGLPEAQYGVSNKIRGHGLRLALLHRCIRWASGEFGADGPLGAVDEQDALAARYAAEFFLGRWILWRPELQPADVAVGSHELGLSGPPGDDPALLCLAATAAASQRSLLLIERLIRRLRGAAGQPVPVTSLEACLPPNVLGPGELQAACSWLVENGQAAWAPDQTAICLTTAPARRSSRRRGPKAGTGVHA